MNESTPSVHENEWKIVETHYSHPVPSLLRKLYDDESVIEKLPYELTITKEIDGEYTVEVTDLCEKIEPDSGFEACEGLFEFANDRDNACLYLVDPQQKNPEVMAYFYDVAELCETGLTLEEFLKPLELEA